MPDNDIFALGFGFDNSKAKQGITALANDLFALEGTHERVKKTFESGFSFGNANSGTVAAFTDLMKAISSSGTSVASVASGFKNIAAVLPKLSAVDPVPDNAVAKMKEFSLAGTAAGNSLNSLIDGTFVVRMQEGRKELGSFNAALLAISKSARETKNHLVAIPGMLNKLKTDTIKPVSKDTLEKLNRLSFLGEKAASSLLTVVPAELPPWIEYTGRQFFFLASNIKVASESAKDAKRAFDGLKNVLPKLSAKTIQPVTEQTIRSMREYAAAVNSAAVEISRIKNSSAAINQSKTALLDLGSETVRTASRARSLGGDLLNIATMTSLPMFFRNSAREAVNFGSELAQIESLTLNFSADKLRSGLLALPSAFGDARKNANALYYAYSSGVEGTEEDLVRFTGQVSKLAQVIRANQTDTVNAVTSAFNAYNLSVKDAGEVSDLFYAIVKRGKAEGNELATGLGQVIPTAATAGLKLNEMGAALTSLTKVMNTRNSITYLNNMISKLIKPTKESRLEAKKLGIELGLDALRAKGFAKTMEELRQKTLGNQEALLKIFPDLRGQRAALQLLNKGWGDYQSQLDFFSKKAGITDAAFEKLNDSMEYQLSILPQTFGKIKIAAGEVMTGILTLGGALEPLVREFNNMGVFGQRVAGSLTLLAAVYGLLRAKTALFTAVQSVEVRHQQILSALRKKEVVERTAVTAAVNSENVAKQRAGSLAVMLNKFGKSQVGKEYALAQARYASAIASGRVAAITKAQLALDKTREIFVEKENMSFIQKNKLLMLENQLLKQNTALKLANMKAGAGASIFGAKGFSGGFTSGMGNAGSAWGNIKWASGKRQLVLLRRNMASFGKMMGSVVGFAAKIFSPLNIMISGAVGAGVFLLDFLTAKGDTLDEKLRNTRVISTVANGIYDFFTGAITEAERLSKFLDNKADAKLFAKNMGDIGKELTLPFSIAAQDAESFKTQRELLQSRTKKAFANLESSSMKANIREYNKVQKEIEDFGDMPVRFDWAGAAKKFIKSANKKYGANLKETDANDEFVSALRKGGLAESDAVNEIKKAVKKEEEAFIEKQKQYDALKNRAQELSGKITPAIEAARRSGESEISLYTRQRALFKNISSMFEAQRFAMMKPAEQFKKQQSYILQYKNDLQKAIDNGNGEIASRSVKNILDTYKDIIQKSDRSIKEMVSFIGNLAGDKLESLLKSVSDPARKIKLLNDRAKELFNESGINSNLRPVNAAALDNSALENSYRKGKDAISLQIRAVELDIEAKKRLAEAEQRANDSTMKFIQSLDKFTTTAADGVEAMSTEAIKLQNRTFLELPKFTPQTQNQIGLQAEQIKLQTLYDNMARLAENFKTIAQTRKSEAENRKNESTAALEKFMQEQSAAAEKAAKDQLDAIKKLLKKGEDIEKLFRNVNTDIRKTADSTTRSANAVSNLTVATYA